MDPIFEAYKIDEVISRYTQVANSKDKPIGKVLNSIAKLTGNKAKGIYYKDAPIANLNLIKEADALRNMIGKGSVGLAIIRDPGKNTFQTILYVADSKKYDAVSKFGKYKSFREIEKSLIDFEKGMVPKPSAADVNAAAARHGNKSL
jgi:hypothetical protein